MCDLVLLHTVGVPGGRHKKLLLQCPEIVKSEEQFYHNICKERGKSGCIYSMKIRTQRI